MQSSPNQINTSLKIVILGCGTAGVSTGVYARKLSRSCHITLISNEDIPEYSRCGLPYAISGEVPEFEDLIIHPVNWYKRLLKADILLKHNCTKIDTSAQQLQITDSQTEDQKILKYDKLILATGSRPNYPPVRGVDKKRVYPCWSMADAKKIKATVKDITNVVVIGAGLIGMEVAESLHKLGKHVSIIEYLPEILPTMIDYDLGKFLREKVVPKDIDVYVNWAAQSIIGDDFPTTVIAQNRETHETSELPAEMVILATGVRPNTELGQKAGIPVGPTNGFVVNEKQETSVTNVYAAGDCAEYRNTYWKQPILPALGSIAIRQGKVAGINAVGGNVKVTSFHMNRVTKLFDHEIAAIGMTTNFAARQQIEFVAVRGRGSSLPEYFPGGKDITLKCLFDKESKILKAAQIIGEEEVAQRINTLSLAINKYTAHDLSALETCYAPPIAPTWDVINIVGEAAKRRLDKP